MLQTYWHQTRVSKQSSNKWQTVLLWTHDTLAEPSALCLVYLTWSLFWVLGIPAAE